MANGILRKSIESFLLIAGAIFIPFQSIPYFKEFGYDNAQIFAGWGFLYLLILFIYASYSYYKQGKDYFKYSLLIIQFLVMLPISPFIKVMRFITNTFIGFFYLQYLSDLIKQNKKTKTQKEDERMGKILEKSFKDLFNVPTVTQKPKQDKLNKKGQVLFIALLIALLIILLILLYMLIVKK